MPDKAEPRNTDAAPKPVPSSELPRLPCGLGAAACP